MVEFFKMILERLIIGPIETNCYMIACQRTLKGAIIDPGGDGERIIEVVKKKNLTMKYIINTHAHIDHIQANQELKDVLKVPVYLHKEDEKMLKNPSSNLSLFLFSHPFVFSSADKLLSGGEEIKIGLLTLSILHTPSHTPGSISIVVDRVLFTGDTLFAGGIGRTDLPLGNYHLLIQSIKEHILSLPDDYMIYPGHGPFSTVGKERKENPFLL